MKPLDYPLLADENIHPEVVYALVARGHDVRSVREENLIGTDDPAVLQRAHAQGRVCLTHDSDFGRLAVHGGSSFTGIIYLRPGHIKPAFVLEALSALALADIDVTPPFVIVVDRRGDSVRVRVRTTP